MTIARLQLTKLITAGDCDGIVTVLRDLTPAERMELVAPIMAFEREERRRPAELRIPLRRRGAFTLAAAGILPTSRLAQWITRHGWLAMVRGLGPGWYEYDVVELALELLRVRKVQWVGDLARRVAQARTLRTSDVRFVAELAASARIDLPVTESLTRAWAEGNQNTRPDEIDPMWDPLLMRLFDVVDVGRYLVVEDELRLGRAITAFVADGRLNRAEVIDHSTGALLRGGPLRDIKGYLAVYDALLLTVPEIVERTHDYRLLMANGHSAVATMARRELGRAGVLPVGRPYR